MNEELQRELLSILRAMKDGTPDAFNELLSQRVLYCWASAIPMLLAAVVSAILLVKCVRTITPECQKDILDQNITVMVGCVVGTIAFGLALIGLSTSGFAHVAEAIAPLGRVLEALR